MARTDNLTNFLTDVASAIKEKTGENTVISASDFDTKIANIQTGSTPEGEITITENGFHDVKDYASAYVQVAGAGGKYAPRAISFYDYKGEELDDEISNLDTSNLTSMAYMFRGCTKLTRLNTSQFDTSKVTSMSNLFYNCYLLTNIDVSKFDTSKVTSMYGMFYGCKVITELNLKNFDTKNVTSMGSMFQNCAELTELDLSSFTTKNVTSVSQMFYGCSKLKRLDIRNCEFDHISTSNASNMFTSVPKDCLIIVKNQTQVYFVRGRNTAFTNIVIASELQE